MAQLSFNKVRLSGISACVPKQVLSNNDYDWISVEDRKSLIKNTGVLERRIAADGVTTSDLCFVAAEQLIEELGWNRGEIDALIFVSQSGDYILPATAVILQHRLGLSKNCMALDVGLGCSGYVYGLSLVSSLVSSGNIKKALLLAGDKSSASLSPQDKSAFPLFGDAGTASAVEFDENKSTSFYNLQSDGSGYQNIIITDGLCRNPVQENSLQIQVVSKGIERRPMDLILDGTAIFDFALREVIPAIKQTLAYAASTMESIDYFVLHQANLLMNETLRKMMKIPAEKVPYSIRHYGNTSSASIPLTIVTQLKDAISLKPLKLLLSGFGVGLSWGTAVIKTNKIVCPDLIEYDA